jgi:Tfp pilus assembly protein PilO
MSTKNIFVLLLISFAVSLLVFNYAIYDPAEQEKELLQKQLLETENKFNNANHAKLELENIREKLNLENEKLEKIKLKFITKNELSSITFQMRDRTKKHKLKLIGFTPIFEQYFADTSKALVKALPFSITLSGKFIDIGKFIESWANFNFYIVPDEIHLVKMNNKTNNLEAVIVGRFYAWSNTQG